MATVFALRDKWAKGEPVFGIFASLPCAFACEVATIKGVDYVCVDQQHGVTDYRDMIEMARAIDARGSVPLTRVPANEDWVIGKNLDAGAQGVIIPMVSNPEQARKAVAACRYPPKGERSNGPARAAIVMGTRDQKALGDGVLCLPMIETREGLEKVEAIAATPGLDGLYIGPSDLAISLGLGPGLAARNFPAVDGDHRHDLAHRRARERLLRARERREGERALAHAVAGFARELAHNCARHAGQDSRRNGRGGQDVAIAPPDVRGRQLEHDVALGYEECVVGAATLRFGDRGHVLAVARRLDPGEQPVRENTHGHEHDAAIAHRFEPRRERRNGGDER